MLNWVPRKERHNENSNTLKGGANYTTEARLKEVALARGHSVEVINYAKCYVSIEKNQPVVRYKGRSCLII